MVKIYPLGATDQYFTRQGEIVYIFSGFFSGLGWLFSWSGFWAGLGSGLVCLLVWSGFRFGLGSGLGILNSDLAFGLIWLVGWFGLWAGLACGMIWLLSSTKPRPDSIPEPRPVI